MNYEQYPVGNKSGEIEALGYAQQVMVRRIQSDAELLAGGAIPTSTSGYIGGYEGFRLHITPQQIEAIRRENDIDYALEEMLEATGISRLDMLPVYQLVSVPSGYKAADKSAYQAMVPDASTNRRSVFTKKLRDNGELASTWYKRIERVRRTPYGQINFKNHVAYAIGEQENQLISADYDCEGTLAVRLTYGDGGDTVTHVATRLFNRPKDGRPSRINQLTGVVAGKAKSSIIDKTIAKLEAEMTSGLSGYETMEIVLDAESPSVRFFSPGWDEFMNRQARGSELIFEYDQAMQCFRHNGVRPVIPVATAAEMVRELMNLLPTDISTSAGDGQRELR